MESIDELLRHNIQIPTLSQLQNIVLAIETSEEIPSSDYVRRVFRALGEREILKNINGLLVRRPKAWEFNNQQSDEMKIKYKENQRKTILDIVRTYNRDIPIVQNMDFGHTAPQICLPFGRKVKIHIDNKKIFAHF